MTRPRIAPILIEQGDAASTMGRPFLESYWRDYYINYATSRVSNCTGELDKLIAWPLMVN